MAAIEGEKEVFSTAATIRRWRPSKSRWEEEEIAVLESAIKGGRRDTQCRWALVVVLLVRTYADIRGSQERRAPRRGVQ